MHLPGSSPIVGRWRAQNSAAVLLLLAPQRRMEVPRADLCDGYDQHFLHMGQQNDNKGGMEKGNTANTGQTTNTERAQHSGNKTGTDNSTGKGGTSETDRNTTGKAAPDHSTEREEGNDAQRTTANGNTDRTANERNEAGQEKNLGTKH